MTARAASFASSFIQLIWFLCTAHKIKGTLSHHSIIQSQLRLRWEAHSKFSCNSMCGRAVLEELDHMWMCCRYRVTLPAGSLSKKAKLEKNQSGGIRWGNGPWLPPAKPFWEVVLLPLWCTCCRKNGFEGVHGRNEAVFVVYCGDPVFPLFLSAVFS